jgi:hypothetical protein
MKALLVSFPFLFCSLAEDPPYIHKNDLPPRIEWDENYGYCGETSYVVAGLYFGQYCSQYTVRALTSPGIPQHLRKSQLLLGVNDDKAADAMRLKYEQWNNDSGSSEDFLVWVKHHVSQNHPVIIGLLNNEYIFEGDTDPDAGQPDYDHIVPVTGIGSFTTPIDDGKYHGNDRVYYSDNGFYTPNGPPIYNFDVDFDGFQLTREEANNPNGPVYSLLKCPNSGQIPNYGIAFLGIEDDENVTFPVKVATNLNYESPEIKDGSDAAPTPSRLTLTITVENLASSSVYNLYFYDDFTKVPTKDFNANANLAKTKFVIHTQEAGSYTLQTSIMSNDIAIFRAVSATSP